MSDSINAGSIWFSRIKAWWRKGTSGHNEQARRQTTRPSLECLEQRDCPTSVQAFATALNNKITADVSRFVRDAAIVEYYKPTLLARTVVQDLVQINADLKRGNTLGVFADFQRLGRDVLTEAALTVGYHLPSRYALLSYKPIVSDLVAVGNDKQLTYAFIGYIATHTRYHATGPTSSVFSTGLFAPGTIAGDTQAILAAQYQHSLTHYSGSTLASYDHYFASLSGSIAASEKFDALAAQVNPSSVTYSAYDA